MIDIHLHLDGSLSREDFVYLAKKNNISLGEDFPKNIVVPNNCNSLDEYLKRFDLPCSLLQDEESISYAFKSLIDRLYDLGYIYAEIRFAPQLHTLKNLNEKEVILSAIKGLESGLKGKENFDANIILCLMRHASHETNRKTIDAAIEINHPKIVAIDLAGGEKINKTIDYLSTFEIAAKAGLNIIIHAGEACGNESIIDATKLHAKRIGHGVHLSLDKQNIEYIKSKNLVFEFCPTSNLQTKSLLRYEDVPLKQFIDNGLKVTINADNMTVSDTDVIKEFKHLYKTFKLSKQDVKDLLYNSIDGAFLKDKSTYKKLIDERIDKFYKLIIS